MANSSIVSNSQISEFSRRPGGSSAASSALGSSPPQAAFGDACAEALAEGERSSWESTALKLNNSYSLESLALKLTLYNVILLFSFPSMDKSFLPFFRFVVGRSQTLSRASGGFGSHSAGLFLHFLSAFVPFPLRRLHAESVDGELDSWHFGPSHSWFFMVFLMLKRSKLIMLGLFVWLSSPSCSSFSGIILDQDGVSLGVGWGTGRFRGGRSS